MAMRTRFVLLSAGALISVVLTASVLRAEDPVADALASAYQAIKADPDLKDEASRHAKFMEMADEYSQLAEAAFQATEDLQGYAAKVRLTGLMLGRPLAKIKQFDKGLKKITEHPAFKAFQKYAALKGQASTVLDVGSRLTATLKNPDLPPSARNSLTALQVAATGLEQLGEVPLVGAALEGYGKILSGLTDVMNDLASKASTTTKEGVFSRTEEAEQLQGLGPKQQFVKTPLWHRGIRLVQEYPFGTGEDRYYLQMPNGTWVGIADYDALAEVAADYFLTKKKNPDAQTLWKYFNDPDERDKLAFWAQVELENRRIEEVLGDLPGVDRKAHYTQFTEAQERIKRWHKGLGLPLEYDSLNRQIRLEVDNPGAVSKALRARVLRAYPGFAEYLASAGVDPQTLDMATLLERFATYRRGEHLGVLVALGPHLMPSIPADLPEGWWPQKFQEPTPRVTGVPQPVTNAGTSVHWEQFFTISNEPGAEWDGHRHYIPAKSRAPEFVGLAVFLEPRFSTWTHEGKTLQLDARDRLQAVLENTKDDCRWLDEAKNGIVWIRDDNIVQIDFVHGGVYAMIQAALSSRAKTVYSTDDCLALVKHFTQVVTQKIDGQQK
jgi:hypothetical protein